jgi:DNA-binding NtrC family response regulator
MNKEKKVLIVDDDENLLEVLSARLTAAGLKVFQAASGPEALKILARQKVDILVTDMKMPEMSGMELFEKVSTSHPYLPVIFLTAYGTVPDAVHAIKAGAVDYITKPFEGRDLVVRINDLLTEFEERAELTEATNENDDFMWGTSRVMADLKALLLRVAGSNATVLILGESGVGKECIAKLIHTNSPRHNNPYVVVDCGSTPPGLLESELFGHLKGSFTHAIQDKKGLIEAANSGTLFLDEIGNISADMQTRLLRFLEERKIRQVGAIKEKTVDCRVIAATNASLRTSVEEGHFRSDLYYRLKVVTLNIPPLRDRREDIPLLATFFADSYTKSNNLPQVELAQKTLRWLQSLPWPGNVRELKNAIQSGVILCKNNKIQPEDLQLDELDFDSSPEGEDDFSIEQSEKEAIIRALKQTRGVKKEAAELLGISRRAIQYKSKKYNLDSSKFKS